MVPPVPPQKPPPTPRAAPEAGAPAASATPSATVNTVVDGQAVDLPDASAAYAAWQVNATRQPISPWMGARVAASILTFHPSIDHVEIWEYRDDPGTALLVRYARSRGTTAPRTVVIGAAAVHAGKRSD